jgi:hypothetical protein
MNGFVKSSFFSPPIKSSTFQPILSDAANVDW